MTALYLVLCPCCRAQYDIGRRMGGERIRCTACGNWLVVRREVSGGRLEKSEGR